MIQFTDGDSSLLHIYLQDDIFVTPVSGMDFANLCTCINDGMDAIWVHHLFGTVRMMKIGGRLGEFHYHQPAVDDIL